MQFKIVCGCSEHIVVGEYDDVCVRVLEGSQDLLEGSQDLHTLVHSVIPEDGDRAAFLLVCRSALHSSTLSLWQTTKTLPGLVFMIYLLDGLLEFLQLGEGGWNDDADVFGDKGSLAG